MVDSNTRWRQRFSSYKRALSSLRRFIEKESLNELEALGSIHAFETTLYFAGQLLRDYAKAQNIHNIYGPKDATRAASNLGLIHELDIWLEMLRTRSQEHELYRTEVVETISTDIRERFFNPMVLLQNKMQLIYDAS